MTAPLPGAESHVRARSIAVIAVILSLAALKLGRPVMMPFTVGLFFAMLAWPLERMLARRLPRWIALLLAILALVVVLVALFSAIAWSAATVIEEAERHGDKIASLMRRASDWAGGFGVRLPWSEGAADAAAGATAEPESEGNGTATAIAERMGSALFTGGGYIALALGFAALSLAELNDARRKIRQRFSREHADRMLAIGARVSAAFRRYIVVKSLTSLIAGVASGAFALVVGLDFAAVWAFLAFLFEYVPTVGSVLAVIPPAAWAFIQFDGLAKPLAILAGYTALQTFLGNYVDPRIEGRFMAISPLVVLLSIIFWAWMWGPAGALLGVPLTVSVAVVARHFERSRWIWALITEPNGEDTEANGVSDGDDERAGDGDGERAGDRDTSARVARRA